MSRFPEKGKIRKTEAYRSAGLARETNGRY
jgi:hypothetical protein